jgi:hypothetical protein
MRRPVLKCFSFLACASVSGAAFGAARLVGPGQTYAKPCAAFAAAGAGDIIEIDARGNGTYDGDVCAITVNNLTIRGTNGRAHIDAAGKNAQGKAIWVIQGNDTVVENIEFSGASVPDLNGAGIRAEGRNLTLRNCFFHDNQQGILGGAGEVLIDSTEFARNGNCIDPSGCAHSMYISQSTTKFTLQYSYSHSVTDGHLVKSRAVQNFILYNRLTGEAGTDSYEINLPNAGTSYIIGNLIQQGPQTGNSAVVDYGSEGATNAGKDLYVVNNTFVNDRGSGTFVSIAGSVTVPAVVKNNIFLGGGTLVSQSTAVLANNYSAGNPMLANRAGFDYHLLAGSPCANAGVDPGTSSSGISLLPIAQYVHPLGHEARTSVGTIDIGAYELGGGSAGTSGTGGSAGTGGNAGTGTSTGGGAGTPTDGGAGTGTATGGASGGGAGGASGGTGGSAANGGIAGSSGIGGASGKSGASGNRSAGGASAANPEAQDEGGCGCRVPTGSRDGALAWAFALLAASARVWRRSRSRR